MAERPHAELTRKVTEARLPSLAAGRRDKSHKAKNIRAARGRLVRAQNGESALSGLALASGWSLSGERGSGRPREVAAGGGI